MFGALIRFKSLYLPIRGHFWAICLPKQIDDLVEHLIDIQHALVVLYELRVALNSFSALVVLFVEYLVQNLVLDLMGQTCARFDQEEIKQSLN
jgi:hypothetical protein